MYTERITVTLSELEEAKLVSLLERLPTILAGLEDDRERIAGQFQIRLGNALLEKIRDDFYLKASGAAGSDGTMWKELSKATIMRRAKTREEVREQKRSGLSKLAFFGSRVVQILIDTAELVKYFIPGASPDTLPSSGILSIVPGKVIIEVKDDRKKWHHKGTRRGLPSRPFWPKQANFPSGYWQAVYDSCLQGLVRTLAVVISGRRF